jgi:hypothetical protein
MSEEKPTPADKVNRVALKPEQLSKLPKWVQDHLQYIYHDLEQAYEVIDILNQEAGESEYSAKIAFGRTTMQDSKQIIHAPMGIDITPEGRKDALYNIQLRDGQVEIRGAGYPAQLVMYQTSSNVMRVVAVDEPYALTSEITRKLPGSSL